jgi:2-polyprenyl-6-methoxyphenol hydroxylase-like FAD-dependent oxidoreductase
MAGVLAARVLADHAKDVVVIERDRFPPIGDQRKGVPQGRHVHGLLYAGSQVIEDLFPGVMDEMVAAGGMRADVADGFGWIHEGHPHVRYTSGLQGITASRPFLEGHIRRRLLALGNVRVLDEHDATELLWDGDRVSGVRFTRRGDKTTETLDADLVIDATGRGTRVVKWLAEHGFTPPEDETVNVGLRYASRWFRRAAGDNRGCLVTPRPPGTRFGIVVATEGDRYLATVGSYHDEQLPDDTAGFLEFARSLPTAHIYDVVACADPIGDVDHYRFPTSQRRRFERMPRFPDGLLVIGDALCSFNPVFGQGITVAALEARLLGKLLADGGGQLPRRFFRGAAKLIDTPWDIAVGSDLRFPAVNGKRTLLVRFLHWYLPRLHVVARNDRDVAFAFQRVGNLLSPPPALLAPAVLWKVLFRGGRAALPAGSGDRSAVTSD